MIQYKNYTFDPKSLAKFSKEEFVKKFTKSFGKDVNYIYEKFVKPHAGAEQKPKASSTVKVGRKKPERIESPKGSDQVNND